VSVESAVSEYAAYLELDRILQAQHPRTEEHDEMVFIIVHQVHELWFKQLLCEFRMAQRRMDNFDTTYVLHTLRRAVSILKTVVNPIEVLETLSPKQFAGFRAKLGSGSGFQSAQFRAIEAVLGRRDPRMSEYYPAGSPERELIEAAVARPSIYDSLLRYLAGLGHPVPSDVLERDVTKPHRTSAEVQSILLRVYLDDQVAAQVCERLVEIDQGMQEWRYRHVSMAERIIGGKPGTGGSTGASYLRSTLFRPLFPDLWEIRSTL